MKKGIYKPWVERIGHCFAGWVTARGYKIGPGDFAFRPDFRMKIGHFRMKIGHTSKAAHYSRFRPIIHRPSGQHLFAFRPSSPLQVTAGLKGVV